MYLDTDIILALIKDDDWLKKYLKFEQFKSPKTSAITIIEARIVLKREYNNNLFLDVLKKIKNLKIKIIPTDEEIIKKSQMLLEKYPLMGIFDSIHAASAIALNDVLISTDTFYDSVEEINKKDPRYF